VGLPALEAASGIVEIANAAMVRAIRTVSVQRGHDVRRCILVAYGGAGPIHAGRLAQTLGMPRILVPSYSSAFSAYGCLVADLRYDAVRTLRLRLDETAPDVWEGVFHQIERELVSQLEREGVPAAHAVLHHWMDLRYVGQNYEIEVPVEDADDGVTIRRRFDEIHHRLYEYTTDESIEGVNLRVAAIVATNAVPPAGEGTGTAAPGPTRERRAYHGGRWLATPVYARDALPPGREIGGPAMVEDAWSTILVPPGLRFHGDAEGHLWIEGEA
jgi:N-methylhydantoinase A